MLRAFKRRITLEICRHRSPFGTTTIRGNKMPPESLTDVELQRKLVEYGFPVLPVTQTTRKILINKIRNRAKSEKSKITENGQASQHNLKSIILFFDIETSGLESDCDVLQIAVRRDSSTFDQYINPTKPIPWNVTDINHLSNRGGDLYYKDDKVPSQPVRIVLENLLRYLKSFDNKCILVGHNCKRFDAPRVIRIIRKESMEMQFGEVIEGFTDTLTMFREKFPERRATGSLTLKTLVQETLSLPVDGIHNASYDVFILEKLVQHHFSDNELLSKNQSFADALENQRRMSKRL